MISVHDGSSWVCCGSIARIIAAKNNPDDDETKIMETVVIGGKESLIRAAYVRLATLSWDKISFVFCVMSRQIHIPRTGIFTTSIFSDNPFPASLMPADERSSLLSLDSMCWWLLLYYLPLVVFPAAMVYVNIMRKIADKNNMVPTSRERICSNHSLHWCLVMTHYC